MDEQIQENIEIVNAFLYYKYVHLYVVPIDPQTSAGAICTSRLVLISTTEASEQNKLPSTTTGSFDAIWGGSNLVQISVDILVVYNAELVTTPTLAISSSSDVIFTVTLQLTPFQIGVGPEVNMICFYSSRFKKLHYSCSNLGWNTCPIKSTRNKCTSNDQY